jgi:hypothetical protein
LFCNDRVHWPGILGNAGFWGVHSREPVVLLTNSRFYKHEMSFMDGYRYHGLLTQYLPIVGVWPLSRA